MGPNIEELRGSLEHLSRLAAEETLLPHAPRQPDPQPEARPRFGGDDPPARGVAAAVAGRGGPGRRRRPGAEAQEAARRVGPCRCAEGSGAALLSARARRRAAPSARPRPATAAAPRLFSLPLERVF